MMTNIELQDKIWSFILGYYQDYGIAPLRIEIAKGLRISPQLVQYHLYNLEMAGKIWLDPLKKRNILIGRKPLDRIITK